MRARIATWTVWTTVLVFCGCRQEGLTLSGTDGPNLEEGGHTVLLKAVSGRGHVETANKVKELTEKETHWTGLFVLHKEDLSQVCWGLYESVDAAQKNLKRAKSHLTGKDRVAVFGSAMVIPLPGKSIGPPEWDLTTAVGEHTVLVAAFRNVPDKNYLGRKKFAVQYCRRLREHGYQAYYHHGLTYSTVTIGAFPSSSFRMDASGRRHIADPRIARILKDFPELAVNGNAVVRNVYNRRTRKYEAIRRKTYLVRIPRKGKADDGGPPDITGDA